MGNNDDILLATVGSCMRNFTDSKARSFLPVSVSVSQNGKFPCSTVPLEWIVLAPKAPASGSPLQNWRLNAING